MSDFPCNFIWYELMTTDTAAAESFYTSVVGWGARDSGMPDPDKKYTLFTVGEQGVAGMMAITEDMREGGARPGWLGYIGVDDADAYVEKIVAKGGKTFCPPTDIPEVGRFAVVADPHGAVFYIMKSLMQAPEGWQAAPTEVGMVGWHELHAGDGAEAFDFYSQLFGWQKTTAMDMRELGVYQLFSAGEGDIGGMMTKMADTPAPVWIYYFNVDGIEAAITRVKENGGQILMGPQEVPGGMWIVQCFDPQGALFALLSSVR